MRIIVNLTLLFILAVCIWNGYKKGVIKAVINFAVILVSLITANIIASGISGEVVTAVYPFVSGYIEGEDATEKILTELGYEDSDKSISDIITEDTSLRYDYAYECMRALGIYDDAASDLAQDSIKLSEENNIDLNSAIMTVISTAFAYVGCVTVIFIMSSILLNVLVELVNYRLELSSDDEILNEVGGSAVGLFQGFFICILLSWMLGFLGLLLEPSKADRCILLNFFQAFRFITRILI